jgi:hypothetical protein
MVASSSKAPRGYSYPELAAFPIRKDVLAMGSGSEQREQTVALLNRPTIKVPSPSPLPSSPRFSNESFSSLYDSVSLLILPHNGIA